MKNLVLTYQVDGEKKSVLLRQVIAVTILTMLKPEPPAAADADNAVTTGMLDLHENAMAFAARKLRGNARITRRTPPTITCE